MIDGYVLDITYNTITIKKDFIRVAEKEIITINDTETFIHKIIDGNIIEFLETCQKEKTKISMTASNKSLISIGILVHNKYFDIF